MKQFTKAYTAQYDESARYPDRNLESVIPVELRKENFDWMGIETGTNEISNLNTELNSTDHLDSWKEQVKRASEKVFDIEIQQAGRDRHH